MQKLTGKIWGALQIIFAQSQNPGIRKYRTGQNCFARSTNAKKPQRNWLPPQSLPEKQDSGTPELPGGIVKKISSRREDREFLWLFYLDAKLIAQRNRPIQVKLRSIKIKIPINSWLLKKDGTVMNVTTSIKPQFVPVNPYISSKSAGSLYYYNLRGQQAGFRDLKSNTIKSGVFILSDNVNASKNQTVKIKLR